MDSFFSGNGRQISVDDLLWGGYRQLGTSFRNRIHEGKDQTAAYLVADMEDLFYSIKNSNRRPPGHPANVDLGEACTIFLSWVAVRKDDTETTFPLTRERLWNNAIQGWLASPLEREREFFPMFRGGEGLSCGELAILDACLKSAFESLWTIHQSTISKKIIRALVCDDSNVKPLGKMRQILGKWLGTLLSADELDITVAVLKALNLDCIPEPSDEVRLMLPHLGGVVTKLATIAHAARSLQNAMTGDPSRCELSPDLGKVTYYWLGNYYDSPEQMREFLSEKGNKVSAWKAGNLGHQGLTVHLVCSTKRNLREILVVT